MAEKRVISGSSTGTSSSSDDSTRDKIHQRKRSRPENFVPSDVRLMTPPRMSLPEPTSPPSDNESIATRTGWLNYGKEIEEPRSDAFLDLATIRELIVEVNKDARISISSTHMTKAYFRVLYSIDKTDDGDVKNTIFLEIIQCATPEAAERKMDDHLSSFQGSLNEVVRKPKAELGSYAKESDTSVFWIRDTVFVDVSSEDMSVLSGLEDSSDDQHLFIAKKIDEHLEQHRVRPEEQCKSHPELESDSTFYVTKGESFTLKLKGVGNMHELKLAEIEKPDLVFQVANGTEAGEYEFFAMNVGVTKVRMIVAHKSSLRVAHQEVEVVVADGGNNET